MDADDASFGFGGFDDFVEEFSWDAREGVEVSPLVGNGLEVFVDEDAVSFGAGSLLKREGDEVAEAAAGEGVLVWKEAVVGGELGLGVEFGGFGEEMGGEFAGEGGGHGVFEEEPKVAAIS